MVDFSIKLEVKFKYFTSDLKTTIAFSGYWREVLNQTTTPNEGYIIVTIDNACIVHIERKEIARLYDEFQAKNLWDKDHLLVDVHLSTFAESPNLQKTLTVKVRLLWLERTLFKKKSKREIYTSFFFQKKRFSSD